MSENCVIIVKPGNLKFECTKGDNLLQVLNENNFGIKSLCGGEGSCNRCLVKVDKGKFREFKKPRLTDRERHENLVLSCQVEVLGDMEINIPRKSRLSKQQILTKNQGEITKSVVNKENIKPLCSRKVMRFPPPTLVDNTADLERFRRIFKKETGLENISFPHSLIRELPRKLRKNNWKLSVFWSEYDNTARIIDIAESENNDYYGIALDIGTTTVVGKLINLNNNRDFSVAGMYNKQTNYGEDVISRINYIKNHENGNSKLHCALIKTINQIILELITEQEITADQIKIIVAAGNTTMIHTLYNLDPNNIRKDPYIPVAASLPPIVAGDLNIEILSEGLIQVFPAVGSFVGGDITAGVLASDLYNKEKITLFIDIGTNGEIVLGNKEFLISCSASAGPAFEGGGISHGIRAMEGAIEKVNIHPWNYEINYETINNKEPVGICGSGLIELLADLQELDIINRSGKFNKNYSSSRLRTGEDGQEFIVARAAETGIDGDIVITENDIKNLIRSKAAVYAGIKMLLKNLAMEESMLARVLIAGGFGNYLNLEAAIRIGLFPDLPRKCFQYIGNTSLEGAKKALLASDLMKEGLRLGNKMTYLELSADSQAADFMDEFIAAQFIPHTDLDLFPSFNKEKKVLSC